MRLVREEPWTGADESPSTRDDPLDATLDELPATLVGEAVEPAGAGFGGGESEQVASPGSLGAWQREALGQVATRALLTEVERLKAENAALRAEVHHLRRRDDTVNSTMRRIDEELRLAARLQRDFMPKSLPVVGRLRFHVLFRPAGYVSGDLYDVCRLDERHVGFYMADAVGHGMPAALLTMFMRQALQSREVSGHAYRLLRPSESLQRLNTVLVDQHLSEVTFATALCGLVNADTGALLVASAGHPRPVLIPASGEPVELATDGALLGVFPDERFQDIPAKLSPGDRLVVFTDGVEVAFPTSDAGRDEGELSYNAARWLDELVRRRHESAEAMLLGLSDAIDHQAGSLSPADDLTVVLVEMLPEVESL